MIQRDGVFYPDYDERFQRFHPGELERDIPFFLANVSGRTRVIQAGGAMGLYPATLAQHFQHVVTFEPDPENWACLQANLAARDCLQRVRAWNAGLGAQNGWGGMARPEPTNCGANRMTEGGDIPVYALDHFRWHGPVDAIWLDIEGLELAALKGAEQTIRDHSPVIVTEENGNGAKYGVGPTDIEDYLETLGYERQGGVGRDRYYMRAR